MNVASRNAFAGAALAALAACLSGSSAVAEPQSPRSVDDRGGTPYPFPATPEAQPAPAPPQEAMPPSGTVLPPEALAKLREMLKTKPDDVSNDFKQQFDTQIERRRRFDAQGAQAWPGYPGRALPPTKARWIHLDDTQYSEITLKLAWQFITPLTFVDSKGTAWPVRNVQYNPEGVAINSVGCSKGGGGGNNSQEEEQTISLSPCNYWLVASVLVTLWGNPQPIPVRLLAGDFKDWESIDLPVTIQIANRRYKRPTVMAGGGERTGLSATSGDGAAAARPAGQGPQEGQGDDPAPAPQPNGPQPVTTSDGAAPQISSDGDVGRRGRGGATGGVGARRVSKGGDGGISAPDDVALSGFATLTPPRGARSIGTDSMGAEAWFYNGSVYLRTHHSVYGPEYAASAAIAGGGNIYRFDRPVSRINAMSSAGDSVTINVKN